MSDPAGFLAREWPLITRQNAQELTSVGCKSIPASRIYAFNLPAQLVAAEVNGALVVSDLGGLAAPIELGPTASLNEYATLAFSSQGSGLLEVESPNSATVYAPFDPASPHSFVGRDWTVAVFGLDPTAKTLAVGAMVDEGEVIVYDVDTGESRLTFKPGFGPQVTGVAIDTSGTHLAVGDKYGHVFVWDLQSGALLGTFTNSLESWAGPIAFQPKGSVVAVASQSLGGSAYPTELWDLKKQSHVADIPTTSSPIMSLVFSPSGDLLATLDQAGNLQIWDVQSSELLRETQISGGDPVPGLAFSQGGDLLVTGSSGGTIQFWSVPSE